MTALLIVGVFLFVCLGAWIIAELIYDAISRTGKD